MSYDVTTQSNEHVRNNDIYTTRLSGLPGLPGEGGEREKISPNICRSSQTLWCLVPRPLLWPLSRSSICEHPSFLFRRQRVLSDHLTLYSDPYVYGYPGRGNFMIPWPTVLNTGHSQLSICFYKCEYTSVFSHHYTLQFFSIALAHFSIHCWLFQSSSHTALNRSWNDQNTIWGLQNDTTFSKLITHPSKPNISIKTYNLCSIENVCFLIYLTMYNKIQTTAININLWIHHFNFCATPS